MPELSSLDIELLERDLPELKTAAVESPVFAGGRGKLQYRSAGGEKAPTVLLLHGLGSSSAGYRAQLAGLAKDFHVIAWNAPGFGDSSQIEGSDAKIEDYADALEALLRSLGIERLAILAGSSWGSVIAVAFARRYPELLASLVLSVPNIAKGNVAGEVREAELGAMLGMADTSIEVPRSAIADRLLAPDTSPLVRKHVERLRDSMTTDGWRQAIRSLFTIYTPDVISKVSCPIVIVSGTRDKVAPHADHVVPLLAAAPHATSHVLEGCGHMPKLEMPSRFNAILRSAAPRDLS